MEIRQKNPIVKIEGFQWIGNAVELVDFLSKTGVGQASIGGAYNDAHVKLYCDKSILDLRIMDWIIIYHFSNGKMRTEMCLGSEFPKNFTF